MIPRPLAVLLAGLYAPAAACGAAAPHRLGPVAVFRGDSEPGRLGRLDALHVPANAELRLEPRWFAGAAGGSEGAAVEVVARVVRVDGSTLTWRALGEVPPRGQRVALPARATDRVAVRGLVALDLVVAALPAGAEPEGAVHALAGAARLAEPPPPAAAAAALAACERAVEAAGGRLLLAVRLPLALGPDRAPGEEVLDLVAVEAEPDPRAGATPADAGRLGAVAWLLPASAGADTPVAARDGLGLSGTSALAVRVAVAVIDHSLREPPPGPGPDEAPPRRRLEDILREPVPRQIAAARAGAAP